MFEQNGEKIASCFYEIHCHTFEKRETTQTKCWLAIVKKNASRGKNNLDSLRLTFLH